HLVSLQRTRAWKLTTPLSPGGRVPLISQRRMTEPASFGCVVKTASRSDRALPGTYSSRAVRLSVTATAVIACPPLFVYFRQHVTTSPIWASQRSGHLM